MPKRTYIVEWRGCGFYGNRPTRVVDRAPSPPRSAEWSFRGDGSIGGVYMPLSPEEIAVRARRARRRGNDPS